jgi:hypothetical protein
MIAAAEDLARALAALLADEEILRRVGAFLGAPETGQVTLHVVRGEVAGVNCAAMYRRRWRSAG